MKKLLLAVIVAVAAWQVAVHNGAVHNGLPGPAPARSEAPAAAPAANRAASREADGLLARAYQNQQSNVQVRGQGTVQKILPDDNKGSRHQRFLVRLGSGQTLLVAHNIDLAPRVESLREGDSIGFHGEYEWNNKGGVIHWTHHDPDGSHPGGWLEHRGRRYE